jgi:hypothetical protein
MSVTPAAVGLVALVVMHVAVLAGCSWIIGHLRRGVAHSRRRVALTPRRASVGMGFQKSV